MNIQTVIISTFAVACLLIPKSYARGSSKIDRFKLPAPTPKHRRKPLRLWATYYYLHQARAKKRKGINLKSINGKRLGIRISPYDFCQSALQGSVKIHYASRRRYRVYNFAGLGHKRQVNCGRFFPSLAKHIRYALGKTRFKRARGQYGEGVDRYLLQPYRTVAVDPSKIPFGSILYIPKARGVRFRYRGRWRRHDGYFFAADTGGAIKHKHIDVFIGLGENPFNFIKSKPVGKFKAYVIHNRRLQRQFKRLHIKH